MLYDDFYASLSSHSFFDNFPLYNEVPENADSLTSFFILENNVSNFTPVDMYSVWDMETLSTSLLFFYEGKIDVGDIFQGLSDVFNSLNDFRISRGSRLKVPGSFFGGKACHSLSLTIK